MRRCRKRKKQDRSFQFGVSFLPLDIIINILKRLPVKTLIQFKCVAKDWQKLLESHHFIAQHLSHPSPTKASLFFQQNGSCLSWIGADLEVHTFESLDFTTHVIDSCNGLLWIGPNSSGETFIFNAATRQVKKVPKGLFDIRFCDFGFGFGHVNHYKLVKVLVLDHNGRANSVEVYSLTTGSWKEIKPIHLHYLPLRSSLGTVNGDDLRLSSSSVTVNGAMFWLASMHMYPDPDHEFILTFDVAKEVFTLMEGPPLSHACRSRSYRDLLELHNDKLAIVRWFESGNMKSGSCSADVWLLEDTWAARKNWVKKYSVGPFPRLLRPRCLWRGQIVCWEDFDVHNHQDSGVENLLALIDISSNVLKNLPVSKNQYYSVLYSYTESLVPVGNVNHDQ